MIIYFTGTGNSRYLAEIIAAELQDDCISAVSYIKEKQQGNFHAETPFLFVCPVYAWQIPHVFEAFIESSTFTGSKDCYFVLTCGDEMGNAGKGIAALCHRKELSCKGVMEIKMPENYIALFSAPSEEKAQAIITVGSQKAKEAARLIVQGKPFPPHHVGSVDKLKTSLVNPVFYKLVISDKKFYTTAQCTGCGACVKACMLRNIRLIDGKPVWNGNCTHCMACICGCPEEAIEYGKHTKGLRRYFLKKK